MSYVCEKCGGNVVEIGDLLVCDTCELDELPDYITNSIPPAPVDASPIRPVR